jgi:type I restriction enzyme S subunit
MEGNGYKETDIDTIPAEWEVADLGEVVELRRESIQPSRTGQLRYVGLEHLDPGNPNLKRFGTESEVRSAKSRFCRGDVLYGKLRPYLDKAVLAEWDGICATDILVCRPKDGKAYSEYLVNLLHTSNLLNYAISTTTGVNHPRTSWSSLKRFRFPLPPLTEQRTIAAILSRIQQAIETQERINERTKELKRALMAKLFTEGLHGEELKETEIGIMPKSWEVVKLREVVEVKSGKRVPKGLQLTDTPTEFPYIRVVDMKDNSVDQGNLKFLLPEVRDKIKKYIITHQDVYISIAGTTGLIGIVPEILNGANLTENAARLVIRELHRLDKEYLMHALAFESGQNQIRARTTKTSQPKLALSRIETILIGLPVIAEQREIAETLKKIVEALRTREKKVDTLKALFKSMLHQLMTGRIQVKDLEIADFSGS